MTDDELLGWVSESQLFEHDHKWLESLQLSRGTSEDRRRAVELLNKIGMSYKPGAVSKAYNSGEIPTALVSGRALASPHDIVRWALAQKYRTRGRSGFEEICGCAGIG